MDNNILKHRMAVMNNIAKSFGYEKSEDLLEKAEDNDIEKAKHQDGDMHPNGKWVWRASANGGKGDWRVAKTGSSKATTGGGATTDKNDTTKTSSSTLSDKEKNAFVDIMKKNSSHKDAHMNLEQMTDDELRKFANAASLLAGDKTNLNDKTRANIKGWMKLAQDEQTARRNNKKTTSGGSGSAGNTGPLNASSSYFSKLSNSLIEKYSKKKESVSLSDIEEFYEDFLRDRGQEPTRKAYANEAKKTYDAIVANWNKKSSNTVTHDINGTKVTVTKNSDGSYTLEANGKKVKSDDPSFFVNGTNLKPRVKAALAKEVGLETKKTNSTYITTDNVDGYVQKLNKVLDRKGYFAHATRSGSIEIYKKGDRKSLKNLKASIIATDYINWGPNGGLKDKLESVIKDALNPKKPTSIPDESEVKSMMQ